MMFSGDNPSLEMRLGTSWSRYFRLGLFGISIAGALVSSAAAQLTTLRLENYATAPMTGSTVYPGTGNAVNLARVNFMAEDPTNSNRFFVNDLNGPLYTVDRTTKQFTQYLNFDGRGAAPGLFDRLYTSGGFAGGFITFQFDPDYANNGKFYTVHLEQGNTGSQVPSNANYPGLNTTGYTATTAVNEPGNNNYNTVLVEWTDTNINDSMFEGTAREMLRMSVRDRIHPMGDIIFNPTAGPGDADWRVMYVSVGDAGTGENADVNVRRNPQLLNTLGGKILRIAPDTNVNVATTASTNGRYRIPTDNPFTDIANANVRDEIWALGMRNPHRMSWDVDPSDPNLATNNHLIANDIGLHSWEEANIIHKGTNYGYSQREGNEQLINTGANLTGPLPAIDLIAKDQICTGADFDVCSANGTLTPTYPVIQYGHGLAGQDPLLAGDSISSGYVYRGSKIPQLYGKYVFGDITTGAIYYADFADMLAADDGDASTLAEFHSLGLLWDNPDDGPDQGEQLYGTLTSDNAVRGPMHQIVEAGYEARGGQDPDLPGGASVTGSFGRADIRLQVDEDGELYILSKSDGMIRAITGPEPLPGDYNYDGIVDDEDYNAWKSSFGNTVPRLGLWADGNKDGLVDAADYTVWRDNFLAAGGAALAVPEPASAALLIAGLCLLPAARRRRRR